MDGNLYELFGVEEPAETVAEGENEQEVAAPATGENEQEVAAPADEIDNEDSDEETAEGADAGDKPPETGKPSQTKAQRAKNAAARRRAETDAAIAKAVEHAVAAERENLRKSYDAQIAAVGIPNPYKQGETIRTMEELEAYRREHTQKSAQRRLQNGQATPEDIRAIVSELPEIRQAAEAVAQANAAKEQAEKAMFEAQVKEQLEAIHAMDPTVNKLEDILAMDNAEEFARAVREHRMNYLEAFRFVNMDRLAGIQQENARREEVNRQRGKDHLRPVATRGFGAVSVPSEEMALYRQLNPDATDAEIQSHYNKYHHKT